MALRDAKTNIFHTLLSVLGIVIGVAALVGILSLIDGMENYAHRQISQTTSLESVFIRTNSFEYIDNVKIKKTSYSYLDFESYNKLINKLGPAVTGYLSYQESGYLSAEDSLLKKGTLFIGVVDTHNNKVEILNGRFISKQDLIRKDSVIVLNRIIAKHYRAEGDFSRLINNSITYKGGSYKVIGIISTPNKEPNVYVPITLIPSNSITDKPPTCTITANSVEDVAPLKMEIDHWIKINFRGREKDFSIITNKYRISQANQGFLVFRIVMGLIVGISVLVGGIGVMNVLLISVNERTTEIGVRKAVGAKPKDIVVQFLSESITISALGSMLGLVIGVLFTMAVVPIIKHFTKIPFEAAYTLNTLLTISLVAILIGIVFGTYPAIKASKLDPVEAIRRE